MTGTFLRYGVASHGNIKTHLFIRTRSPLSSSIVRQMTTPSLFPRFRSTALSNPRIRTTGNCVNHPEKLFTRRLPRQKYSFHSNEYVIELNIYRIQINIYSIRMNIWWRFVSWINFFPGTLDQFLFIDLADDFSIITRFTYRGIDLSNYQYLCCKTMKS